MTREEAIDIFEHNWTRLENHDYTENELNEALNMAIKALEQCEVWDGIHGQVVAPKGTFDRIWNDADKEEKVEQIKEAIAKWEPRLEPMTIAEQEPKTIAEQEPKTIDRLYNWLNDMRFNIVPDDTVMDIDEFNDRMVLVDLIDEIMAWIRSEV